MSVTDDKVRRPITELVSDSDAAKPLYDELTKLFLRELNETRSDDAFKSLRDRWLGRKQGWLAITNDNWLNSAPKEWKRFIGQLQNQLKRQIEQALGEQATRAAQAIRPEAGIDLTL